MNTELEAALEILREEAEWATQLDTNAKRGTGTLARVKAAAATLRAALRRLPNEQETAAAREAWDEIARPHGLLLQKYIDAGDRLLNILEGKRRPAR